MRELLENAKVRAAALLISVLGFALHYAQGWIFHSVDPLDDNIHFVGQSAAESHSPVRTVVGPGMAEWQILVATNRPLSRQPQIVPTGTSTLRTQSLTLLNRQPATHLGACTVKVPLDRPRGACPVAPDNSSSERPPIATSELRQSSVDDFHAQLAETMTSADCSDVMVFVHGFNVSLDEAVCRAAQLAEDMPFHGVMVAYSWNSAADEKAYASDAQVAEHDFWNLAEFLADLRATMPQTARLHVLAHSMGSRVTLRALNALNGTLGPRGEELVLATDRLRQQFPQWGLWSSDRIGAPALHNLIFAAPDVEAREFERFASAVRHQTIHAVLYASDTDVALEGSLHVNGQGHRAGDSRSGVRVDGMRVIHVSGIDRLDPLGHSYYGSNATVLNQLSLLIHPPRLPQLIGAVEGSSSALSP